LSGVALGYAYKSLGYAYKPSMLARSSAAACGQLRHEARI